MNRHRDPAFADTFHEVGKWPIHVQVSHYAGVACRRLERIGQTGKKQPRKPNTEDIDQARVSLKIKTGASFLLAIKIFRFELSK
jgi:Rho GTPase-activating protein 39